MLRKLLIPLTILFVGLKLTDLISWSWWLVLTPCIIEFVLVTLIEIAKAKKSL